MLCRLHTCKVLHVFLVVSAYRHKERFFSMELLLSTLIHRVYLTHSLLVKFISSECAINSANQGNFINLERQGFFSFKQLFLFFMYTFFLRTSFIRTSRLRFGQNLRTISGWHWENQTKFDCFKHEKLLLVFVELVRIIGLMKSFASNLS